MTPPPQYQVQFRDQLLGRQRYASLGKLAHLIHEALDRFLPGIGIQLPRPGTTADLARWQPKLLAALDLVPQKLESRRTCTIRVFCGCSCTPSSLRIRSAAATAACASSADVQVTTQSSAYLVSRYPLRRIS